MSLEIIRQPTGKHCEPQYVHTSSPIWFCLSPRPMCSAKGPNLLLHRRISRRQLCWERDLQVIIMLNKDMDPSKTVQIPQSLDAVTFHEGCTRQTLDCLALMMLLLPSSVC